MRLARSAQFFTRSAAIALLCVLGTASVALAQGTITGRVTAEGTNEPLGDARLIIVGANATATTSQSGSYTLYEVRAGTVEVQVLRVGYQSVKKTVSVPNGGTATLDFQMTVTTVKLQDVVTTATGQQRKVELGNSISTMGDVGLRVEQTEITSVSDLLIAKTPGVVVLPGVALGGAPTIRIRGISSLSLTNAPIYYVDGVRYSDNTATSGTDTRFSLLNNLNPEEIEDIEIVKGPAAATLYGTNAANGVVVITTKKGHAGTPKWTWTAEERNVDDRNAYQPMYANWGHTPANPGTEVRCLLATMGPTTCIQDSLTHYNLLEDPSATFIHMGRGSLYGVNVTGGSEALRYFASANVDNEFGPIQMPQYEINRFQSQNTQVQDDWFHPQAQQKLGLRANFSATVSPQLDLSFNTGFTKSDNRIEPESDLFIALYYTGMQNYGFKGPGLDKIVNDVDGTYLHDYLQYAPGDIMQYVNQLDVHRTTASATANWRPFAWMQNEGTVGMDLAMQNFFSLCMLNQCPPQTSTARLGVVSDNINDNRNLSAKISSTSTWQARTWANFKTTLGGDYTNLENDMTNSSGSLLPAGASTVAAASIRSGSQTQPTAVKTLGLYVQEQVGLRDRMFITLAERTDQNSAFGSNFQQVVYPKASLSWILSDESFFPRVRGLDQFRLRTAYGANGVQPGATSALALFSPGSVGIATHGTTTDTDTPSLAANSPGNSNLKPEYSGEFEAGFDSQLLNNRVHVEYTYYHKKSTNSLISVPIAASSGSPTLSILENVGSTQNSGHEVTMNVQMIDSRRFGWDLTLNGSHNSNSIVSLGIDPVTGVSRIIGLGSTTEQRVGLPIDGQWYHPYTYSDANHDGIISRNEVQVDSSFRYLGVNVPRDLFSIQNGFDLFSRQLRINMMIDYKGGYNTQDGANKFQCETAPNSCSEDENPNAPLSQQARVSAAVYGTNIGGTTYKSNAGYFVNGSFWKFREISAVWTLPATADRWAHAGSGSNFVFGVRNIHYWANKNWTGLDPETNYGVNGSEVQNEFQTAPPPTYFTFRLNLKY
jgi:TonB-linked SusC/RagA family outer membrane protein